MNIYIPGWRAGKKQDGVSVLVIIILMKRRVKIILGYGEESFHHLGSDLGVFRLCCHSHHTRLIFDPLTRPNTASLRLWCILYFPSPPKHPGHAKVIFIYFSHHLLQIEQQGTL